MKRPPLFDAWWTDTTTGERIGRATRRELADANRLWWKHRDIRERLPDAEGPTVLNRCAGATNFALSMEGHECFFRGCKEVVAGKYHCERHEAILNRQRGKVARRNSERAAT